MTVFLVTGCWSSEKYAEVIDGGGCVVVVVVGTAVTVVVGTGVVISLVVVW